MRNANGQFVKGHVVTQEMKIKIGLKNSKGGKPHCSTCGKLLSTYTSKTCIKHMPPMSDSTREKFRQAQLKRVSEGRHNMYLQDRSLLKKKEQRNDVAYQDWRRQVWLRDGFKCKIANPDCKGRIEAHHILSWRDYVELRYEVNNGITLCHAHHPRKRAEEKRLSPYFMELVSVSKVQN